MEANSAHDGGGIYNDGGALHLVEGEVATNTAASDGLGGGILNVDGGTTSLMTSIVSSNSAKDGAGIYIDTGLLTIAASTIRNNQTVTNGRGGGIFVNTGALELLDSTVATNSAALQGGGVFGSNAILNINNTTLSENWAGRWGGGVSIDRGQLNLTNVTIAGNVAVQAGGGVFSSIGIVRANNSIVANSSPEDCLIVSGILVDLGHNIIEDGSCISHATSFGGDPMLGPLADNGGPTMTHALLPGSPATDAGDCAGGTILVDQRGVDRPQGAGCDIGAFEVEILCETGNCPAGTIALVDAQGDFAGWCVGSSDPAHTDIYVDAVVPGQRAIIEISKDYTAVAPITLTFQQVCPDDAAAVPTILIADESITNLTGLDWTDFTWQLTGDHVWFDVPASAQFRVSPPFATKTWSDFLDAPTNQLARALRASDGVVVPFTSYFPGTGTGSLAIAIDLAASDAPASFELVEASSALQVMGDFDADGDADTADFSLFSQCFGGSGVTTSAGCSACDLDYDGDVDVRDFAIFAQNFTGAR